MHEPFQPSEIYNEKLRGLGLGPDLLIIGDSKH